MPDQHALFSPSSAHRWLVCPGSIALESRCENKTSKYAEEGTAAHELLAKTLTSPARHAEAFKGQMSSNGFEFTEEMCEYVQTTVTNIEMYLKDGAMFVEKRLDFSEYVGIENQFGTGDIIILSRDGTELQLHDFKYGMGVKVYAEENEQLKLYGLGALKLYRLLGCFERVRLVIHQPRLDHFDDWDLPVGDLLAFAAEAREAAQLAHAVLEAYDTGGITPDKMELRPGESQCRFCKAKATCPALAKLVTDTVTAGFEEMEKEVIEQSTEAVSEGQTDLGTLGKWMEALPLIEDWCKAVRGRVEAEIFAGRSVPGFKLVEGRRGARAWRDALEVEKIFKAMRLKKEDIYSMKLISPTQAEKMLKSNPRRWEKVQGFVSQPNGKPSVAPESDKRPALDVKNVAELFEEMEDAA